MGNSKKIVRSDASHPSRALNTDSLTKFTPGPWVIIPAREYDGDDDALTGSYTSPAGIEGDDGNPVCVFGTCEGSGTLFENEADYHLIAAAPELYAELNHQVRNCGVCKGEGECEPVEYLFGMSGAKERGPCPKCSSARAILAKARGEVAR